MAGRAVVQSSVTTVSSCGIPIRHVMQHVSRELRAFAWGRSARPPLATAKRAELQVGLLNTDTQKLIVTKLLICSFFPLYLSIACPSNHSHHELYIVDSMQCITTLTVSVVMLHCVKWNKDLATLFWQLWSEFKHVYVNFSFLFRPSYNSLCDKLFVLIVFSHHNEVLKMLPNQGNYCKQQNHIFFPSLSWRY